MTIFSNKFGSVNWKVALNREFQTLISRKIMHKITNNLRKKKTNEKQRSLKVNSMHLKCQRKWIIFKCHLNSLCTKRSIKRSILIFKGDLKNRNRSLDCNDTKDLHAIKFGLFNAVKHSPSSNLTQKWFNYWVCLPTHWSCN